jgi:hypothetical protein
MTKYEPLHRYLAQHSGPTWMATLGEIEAVLGT